MAKTYRWPICGKEYDHDQAYHHWVDEHSHLKKENKK